MGLYQDAAGTTPTILDTDPVGLWQDQSGSGNHASQSTAGKRPLLKLAIQNGRPVIRFDGVDDFLRAPFTLAQPFTRFAVLKNRSAQDGNHILVDGAANVDFWYFTAANTASMYAGTSVVSVPATGTDWLVWGSIFNGASSSLAINGGTPATGNAGSDDAAGVTLGAFSDGSVLQSDMDVGEVLIWSGALTSSQMAQVFAYLKSRWGIV